MRPGTSVIAHPSAHVSLVQRATPSLYAGISILRCSGYCVETAMPKLGAGAGSSATSMRASQEDDREVRRDSPDPAERALTALAPRRLREAGAAGRTAFPRGAMCERRRQLVRHRLFVPVQGTVAQTPESRMNPPEHRIAQPPEHPLAVADLGHDVGVDAD